MMTHLYNVQGLIDGGFGIKGESGIDFSGNLAGDNIEYLIAKFD